MTDHPEGTALRTAVCREPKEDTVRLAYADWLDENGDPERAEFVRLQVALYGRPYWGLCGPRSTHAPACAASAERRHECNAHGAAGDRMRNRAGALFAANWAPWGLEVPGPCTPHGYTGFRVFLSTPDNAVVGSADFERGLVTQVSVPTELFLQTAGALFRRHPITSVVLTDLDACLQNTDNGKVCSQRYHCPIPLYHLLTYDSVAPIDPPATAYWKRWDTRGRAERAWSDACVAHGRARAGLPELTPVEAR